MKHSEIVRIVPGADTAVLFIHGIVGTPNHFVKGIPLLELVPEGWSVYNLLLPGHGKTVEDFSRSSMKLWKEKVWSVFSQLSLTHKQIILVGHSMGTLFAIQLALEYPEKIPFAFLLAVPLRPWIRLSGMVNCLRLAFGKIREDHSLEVAVRNACGVKTTRKLWKYMGWIPRFLELFREIAQTEKKMSALRVPAIAFQSEMDELVCNRSRRILERSGVFEIRNLKKSSHFYYHPEDAASVRTCFLKQMKKKA